MTTVIDLTRINAPSAIEVLSYEELLTGFKERFQAFWEEARLADTSLPPYDVSMLETDPAIISGQAWSWLRLLDRGRVNDGIRALLGPLSTGTNLDNLVAGRNIERLTIVAATGNTPAVMESDFQLLRRYLLSFDAQASGSSGRYLFDAYTAWPAMLDARVIGFDIHGRRGDTDVVIIGPAGALPTDEQRDAVSAAVRHINRMPEGVAIAILAATRVEYDVDLTIEVPAIGPAPSVLVSEAAARVRAAGDERTLIGGEVPAGFMAGVAYGPNILKVRDNAPVAIDPDPYKVPVLGTIAIGFEVRA
jgi:phage-related baseplate assembly protein